MRQILMLFGTAWLLAVVVVGQTVPCISGNKLGETFELKGVVSDSTGPLGKMVVIVFPMALPQGKAVTRYWYGNTAIRKEARRVTVTSDKWEYFYATGDDGPLPMMNTRAWTDEKGAFSMKVWRGLFMDPCQCVKCTGYRAGEIAIGIFKESGKGKFESMRELETVRFDTNASTVDAGRIFFKPAVGEPQNKAVPKKPE